MAYTRPEITDLGAIGTYTFFRCDNEGGGPPKDWRIFGQDNFGECSEGHALS